jgi:hypothetical protein
MRSKIEMSWNSVYTPADVPLQVLVNDGSSSDYLLHYPCKLTPEGWVNAATGSPLQVRPTIGRSTGNPPRQKARKLKKAPNELSREEDQCRQLLD